MDDVRARLTARLRELHEDYLTVHADATRALQAVDTKSFGAAIKLEHAIMTERMDILAHLLRGMRIDIAHSGETAEPQKTRASKADTV